ncbi:MAG: phage major capsid protein [Clostridia bacterium]|nr:phage major capsid protein [Clostridia bacterium]
MSVTLSSVDNALKTYYLDAMSSQLNNASPFYAKIKHSTENIYGKEVKKMVSYGVNGGIGAGSEDGDLPKSSHNDYNVFTSTLKNLYGTIEISDKAIRASASNQGAFVNLLNAEMDGLLASSKYNFQRMLFGDGTGKIGKVTAISNGVISLSSVIGLKEGMLVDFISSSGSVLIGGRRVLTVTNTSTCCITVDGIEITTDEVPVNSFVTLQGSYKKELSGLEAVFALESPIYGVDRSTHLYTDPITTLCSSLTESAIQKMIDELDERSGSQPDMIICSYGVRRKLLDVLSFSSRFTDTMQLDGGFTAITYNGIPVIADKFCPKGTMYFLHTDDFTMYELCDWEWIAGDDGQILKQVAGKPVYTATLVKYAELLCSRPYAQGKFISITEA